MKNYAQLLIIIPCALLGMEKNAPLTRVDSDLTNCVSRLLPGLRAAVFSADAQRLEQLLKNKPPYLNTHFIGKTNGEKEHAEDERETLLLAAITDTHNDIHKKQRLEKIVGALILHGADVDDSSASGLTPLLKAILYEQREIAKILIEKRAAVDKGAITINRIQMTPLQLAQKMGQTEIVELIEARLALQEQKKRKSRKSKKRLSAFSESTTTALT